MAHWLGMLNLSPPRVRRLYISFGGGDISLDVGRGKRLIKGNQAWPGRVVFFMFHLTVKRGVQVEHGSEITIQFLLKNGSTHRSH
ncbi:hypothetical protein D9M69_539950 [compost metagenome]